MEYPLRAMNVVCYGTWRAASLLWQPSPGAWALTVACHAAFELAPGESPIVAKPTPLDPVKDDDERAFVEPWGPPAPMKQHPEVIVVGHAYAAPGSKVTSLVARLGVGDLEKLLHVHGDTYFTPEGALAAPVAFDRMPLRWDRAAGAPDEENPVGVAMGKAAVADAQGRVFLPNLRPMGTSIRRRDEVVAPVGFGPIRPTWPSRVERLHRYAASWDPQRWAEQPLPVDFDISYFNVAPPDQMLDTIAGNERIFLEHLHPRFPRLVTHLGAATPCVVASLAGVEQNVPVVCDTLVIDSDRGLAFLVWRGQVPLSHPQQEGVVFVSAAPIGASVAGTVAAVWAPASPALPFQRAGARRASPAVPSPRAGARVDETLTGAFVPASTALPFQRAGARVDETLMGESLPTKPALPFHPAPEDAPSPEAMGDAETGEEVDDEDADPPTLRHGAPAGLTGEEAPKPTVASSIERCAAVAARLASPGADRAAILEAEELSPEEWEKEHVRWLGEITDELDRGKKKLLAAYDSAYVAAIEDLRGPIAAGEYARLSLAADRGEAAPVLAELGLPEHATSRIRRVWRARMAK
jgi:hypothetical protein